MFISQLKCMGLTCVVLMSLTISACGQSAPRPVTYSWSEDVAIDAQQSILVKRSVTINETNSLSGDAYNAVETAATIEFTGDLASVPRWSEPLRVIAIYQDHATAEWTVVGTTTSCEVWSQKGQPKPPYWEYRLQAGVWRQVPLSATSIGREGNVTRRYKDAARSGHVTSELRLQLEAGTHPARTYREVYGDPDQYFCGHGDINKLK